MKQTYDAVIIGAGNGGLISACRLAKQKKKVLLLEQHNIPGGFATSFRRGRFEFEASLHELCEFGTKEAPGSLRLLFDELEITDLIEWIPLEHAYCVMSLRETTSYTMPLGRKNFINQMEEYVPKSRKSMEDFFHLCDETAKAMGYISSTRGNPEKAVLKKDYPNFMRVAAHNLQDVLTKGLHMPTKAIHILTTYWTYLGANAEDLSFIHYGLMMLGYIDQGAYIPKSRSHEMSLAIEHRFCQLGGEVWYHSKVEEILTNQNHVTGVRLTDGTEIMTNHVICNASPHSVYSNMIPEKSIPKEALQLANARSLSPRGFSIFLGLNRDAETLGLTKHSYFLYDDLDSIAQTKKMITLENSKAHIAVCLNNANPDCSPKGTSIMYFTSLYFSDVWKDVTPESYFDVKNKVAKQFITTFEERTGISLLPYIEEIEVATPVTYAHYTGAPNGSIYGYQAQDFDNLMPRLMRMYQENYLKGLRFCGGSAMRLAGYNSAYLSGDVSGKLTLLDMQEDFIHEKN